MIWKIIFFLAGLDVSKAIHTSHYKSPKDVIPIHQWKSMRLWKLESDFVKHTKKCSNIYQRTTCMDQINFNQKHGAFTRDLDNEVWECCHEYFEQLNMWWCNWHEFDNCENLISKCFNQRNLNIFGASGLFDNENTCVQCVMDPSCSEITGTVELAIPAEVEVFADCNNNKYRDDDEPYYHSNSGGAFSLDIKCEHYTITAHYTSFDDSILLTPAGPCENCKISLFSTLVAHIAEPHTDIPELEQQLLQLFKSTSVERAEIILYSTVVLYSNLITYMQEHSQVRRLYTDDTRKRILELFIAIIKRNLQTSSENSLPKILEELTTQACESRCQTELQFVQTGLIKILSVEESADKTLEQIKNMAESVLHNGEQCEVKDAYMYGYVTACSKHCHDSNEAICTNQCVKWSGAMTERFHDTWGYTDIRGGCGYEAVTEDDEVCQLLLTTPALISDVCCSAKKRLDSGGRQCAIDN